MMPLTKREAARYELKTMQVIKQFDRDMEVRYWKPAEAKISSTDGKEENGSLHINTDGATTRKINGQQLHTQTAK